MISLTAGLAYPVYMSNIPKLFFIPTVDFSLAVLLFLINL